MSTRGSLSPQVKPNGRFFTLNTDGGLVAKSGQAGGEASIGVVLKTPGGSIVHELSARLGWAKDHHVAEYEALLAGLRLARGHGIDQIRAYLDSALVVNQVNGRSKVNAEHLKPLWRDVHVLVRQFTDIELSWVPRKENNEADTLASGALEHLRIKK